MEPTKQQKPVSFRKYDVIMLIAIVLMLGVHLATNTIIVKQSEITGADYNTIVEVHEANPVAKWALQSQQLRAIFSFVLIPAMLGAFYWLVRRGGNVDYIGFTSIFFLLMAIFNINNDIGFLLGLMLK